MPKLIQDHPGMLLIMVPLGLAVLWGWARRYYRREAYTPAPYDRANDADIHSAVFNIKSSAIWIFGGGGLLGAALGVSMFFMPTMRYGEIGSRVFAVLFLLSGLGAAIFAVISRGDRVRVSNGVAHYYQLGKKQWSLPLSKISSIEIEKLAFFQFVETSYLDNILVNSVTGEVHRIRMASSFEGYQRLCLLLSTGGGQWG